MTTKINSTNNPNTNNNTVNDTNSTLIPSSTTTSAKNNRTGNKNRNNNAVSRSDTNKWRQQELLTPTSTSTTATNNNTNILKANNSENNTSSKFILSNIDEKRFEYEKRDYGYSAKQEIKEKIPVLNLDQWKKGTTLIAGDSMLAGLRESKFPRSKRTKVRYFPGRKLKNYKSSSFLS